MKPYAVFLEDCRNLTNIISKVDFAEDLSSVFNQKLGDTIFVYDSTGNKLGIFAIGHDGKHTEAGGVVCYVRFGATTHRNKPQTDFEKLFGSVDETTINKAF